ncbi:site-specific integrase [Mycolicibacterium frederiksbergense]|uniref:site-specific integrase n=1 Tax=Mycolicibacterium frederiksbergense TaxID=117567 RepID=UPI001F3919C5|nr:site-specific integrase [Mycolicibacterium frederiksbergense]
MTVRVRTSSEGYAIDGPWEGCAAANAFLVHLVGRGFSAATVRAYAFDVLNLARFLLDRDLAVAAVTPVEVFEWIDWQDVRRDPGATRREGMAGARRHRRLTGGSRRCGHCSSTW